MYKYLVVALLGLFIARLHSQSTDSFDINSLDDEEREIFDQIKDFLEQSKDDDDDDDEPLQRGLMDQFKALCGCTEENDCGCCWRKEVMFGAKLKVCGNVSAIPSEYAFNLRARIGKLKILNQTMSAKRLERVCDRLPGPLSSIKLCMYSTMKETEAKGLNSCFSLDVITQNTTIISINFSCMKFENGKLSFEKSEDPSRDAVVTVKSGNPIKSLINLLKKKGN